MGYYFNQQVELPSNLTHLNFGYYLNQQVELPPNLTHLTFGVRFNQKVELSPNLTFGNMAANQEVWKNPTNN